MTAQNSFLRIFYTVSLPNNANTDDKKPNLLKNQTKQNKLKCQKSIDGSKSGFVQIWSTAKVEPQLHKDPFFVPSFTVSFTSIPTMLTNYCHFLHGHSDTLT